MPTRFIINADDFGLTPGINRAIAELHDAGALTSATLMASGPAFDHAVALALQRPHLGVGCHLVFTDGTPIARPQTIPSLLASNRHTFRPNALAFVAALLGHQIDPDEIEREAVAQILRLQHAGLTVTHVDTHKHTHIFPAVLRAVLRACLKTGVHALRNPFEQPWAFPLSNGTIARTSQIRAVQIFERRFLANPLLRSGQLQTSNGTIGISATGSLDETSLRNLVHALPPGTWELVCHPGYNDADLAAIPTRLRATRDIERRALLAVLSQAARSENNPNLQAPKLIHYGRLA